MRITLEIEVEKTDGKFAWREDIEHALCDVIGGVFLDLDESSYEVADVGAIPPVKKAKEAAR